MTGITIIGAGLAGLLAGRILGDKDPVIVDKTKALPNNHKAVLRFRTDVVAKAAGVPFKKVRVLKAVARSCGNSVADAVAYSDKVTGMLQPRSILNLDPVERFIAPSNLVARLGAMLQHNLYLGHDGAGFVRAQKGPVISTVPMPLLMQWLDYQGPKPSAWGERPGWTIRGKIPSELQSDIYATLYYPHPDEAPYRASITGSDIMIEGVIRGEDHYVPAGGELLRIAGDVLYDFGIFRSCHSEWRHWNWEAHEAQYQKIADLTQIDRERAKAFIMWATAEHNVYSLGRFATWRPGLLLDDVVQDVQVIRSLLEGGSAYHWVK